MRNALRALVVSTSAFVMNCATMVPSTGIEGSITANKSVFVAGQDEVDISFTAINRMATPIPYLAVREQTVLVINGKDLKDSFWIFSNGPHAVETLLQPGQTSQFGYRMTKYFLAPGTYHLVWRGVNFKSDAISFRVVSAK